MALDRVAKVVAFFFWPIVAVVGRWPWPWSFMRPVMRSNVRRRSEAVVVAEPAAATVPATTAVPEASISACLVPVCGAGSSPSAGCCEDCFRPPLTPRHRLLREGAAGISIAYSPPSLRDRTTTTDPGWRC